MIKEWLQNTIDEVKLEKESMEKRYAQYLKNKIRNKNSKFYFEHHVVVPTIIDGSKVVDLYEKTHYNVYEVKKDESKQNLISVKDMINVFNKKLEYLYAYQKNIEKTINNPNIYKGYKEKVYVENSVKETESKIVEKKATKNYVTQEILPQKEGKNISWMQLGHLYAKLTRNPTILEKQNIFQEINNIEKNIENWEHYIDLRYVPKTPLMMKIRTAYRYVKKNK